jgi:hypothetical protein
MDTELVDFLLTIPPLARIEQRVYKKMIAYGYPEIRDIPCTNSGKPVNPNFLTEYPLMAIRYVGRSLRQAVSRRSVGNSGLGRESSDVGAYLGTSPDMLDRLISPLIKEGVFDSEIFDVDAIREISQPGQIADRQTAIFISLLISWGLAATYLMSGSVTRMPVELDFTLD